MYQWPVYVSLLGLNLADSAGSKRLLMSHGRVPQRTLSVGSEQHRWFCHESRSGIVELIKRKLGGLAARPARRVRGRIRDAVAADAHALSRRVEISQGIGADRKVTLTARTIGDLVPRCRASATPI